MKKDARDISRALDSIPDSCPLLNAILSYCKPSDEPLDKYVIRYIEGNIEEIRQINGELRELCRTAHELLEKAESDVFDANKRIHTLENEIERLEIK